MKILPVLLFFLMLMIACQSDRQTTSKTPEILVLDHLDLYPKHPGCPDYFDKDAQLNCLMEKLNTFLNYNLNKQYAGQFKSIKDTLWVKFKIDTTGQTRFLAAIHLKDSVQEQSLKIIFNKLAKQIPKMQPAIYHDRPVSFEFKIPVTNQKKESSEE